MNIITVLLIAVFLCLSFVHFYWLLGGSFGQHAAIPEIDGKPAFQPSALAILTVAIGLMLCALLIAAISNVISLPIPHTALSWLCQALALVLLLRAIGDFRLVGFFKRIRGSRFAYLDTAIYSPLCLVLAIGVAMVNLAAYV